MGVVAIHATSPLLASLAARTGDPTWALRALTALNQAGRFSVPAFFLLSGFLAALTSEESPAGDGAPRLKRRLGRLLVPYLTWSVLLCALPRMLHGEATAADLGTRFLLGWTFTGGYFLPALAQLSIPAPLLLRIVRRGRGAALALLAVTLLFTEALFGAAAYGAGAWSLFLRDRFSASLSLGVTWAPFYVAGLWAGVARRRLIPWMGRHRPVFIAAATAFYASSLWEFRRVHAVTTSLGLAASFLKPTSILFAFAVCAVCLGTRETSPVTSLASATAPEPPAAAWRTLAAGSYAIYLLHGAVVLALWGIAAPWWQGLLETPAGPVLLGACGIVLPVAFYRIAGRRAPAWARYAMFG